MTEIKIFDAARAGLLDGVRVVDLSRLVAGNMATHVLADYGADVIKVERPGKGDDLRSWRVKGIEVFWKVYSRNKRSVALDLQSDDGREFLWRLIDTAQVLVENFVPGTLERWGMGPDDLLRRNPKLVILRVSGWGQTGPWRKKPGFGTLVEAMSGWAFMNGHADKPPTLPPLALADMISGLYGAAAVLAALRAVEQGRRSEARSSIFPCSSRFTPWSARKPRISASGNRPCARATSPRIPRRAMCIAARTIAMSRCRARCSRWRKRSWRRSGGPN